MNVSTSCLSLALAACTLSAQRVPIAAPAGATDERTIQVYDLRDLVADAKAPVAAEPVTGEPEATIRGQVPVLRGLPLLGDLFETRAKVVAPTGPKARLTEIAGLLREFVEPRFDERDGRDEIQVVGDGAIVVLALPAQQAWVKAWLTAARTAPEELLEIEVTFHALTQASYTAHLAPVLARAPRPTQVRVDKDVRAQSLLLAPGAETEAFLSALGKAEGVDTVAAPRVVARMRETADVRSGEHVSYVKDYEVERTPTSAIANPVVGTVWDGLGFSIIGTPLGSGHLGLQIEAIVADLARPIPTFETTLGVGAPVTIQLPSVRIARVRAAVELPTDHIVLFTLADATEKPMVVILRARAIAPRSGK